VKKPKGRKKFGRPKSFAVFWCHLKQHPLARIGPGFITSVADDDPSGIATHSQAGAQFGLDMLWTMPLGLPRSPTNYAPVGLALTNAISSSP